jgi:hypothetical protein
MVEQRAELGERKKVGQTKSFEAVNRGDVFPLIPLYPLDRDLFPPSSTGVLRRQHTKSHYL